MMNFSRIFSMPNSNTLEIKPIKEFVLKYLKGISIDPFARNCELATYTNDLNPDTKSQYHLKAIDFLKILIEKEVNADLIIFDPPYSLRQTKEMYNSIGIDLTYEETLNASWKIEKDLCDKLLKDNGYFLNFGWNSNGMGKNRGFEIEEILLISYGGAHNDTICIAEKRINNKNILKSKEKKSSNNLKKFLSQSKESENSENDI